MKKQCKLWVSLMMAFCMVVGVFAGTAVQGETAKAMEAALTPARVTDWWTLPASAKSTATLKGKDSTPTATVESTAVVFPIQMAYAGVAEIGVAAAAASGSALASGNITANLYSDANCTQAAGTAMTVDATNKYANAMDYAVASAGTYYLQVKWVTTVPAQDATIAIGAFGYSGEEVTLSKSAQLIWTYDRNVTKYHKLKVGADGLVAISGSSINGDNTLTSLTVSLCNKSKKKLSDVNLVKSNDYIEYVALKKGTYYVAAKTDYPYILQSASKKYSESSGASKAKAKALKQNKSQMGLIAMTDSVSSADWYKIKLTKSKKLKLQYAVTCSGSSSLKLEIIPADSQYKLKGNTITMRSSGQLTSRRKLKKGTYYIKVSKTSKSYSGVYSLKYK